MKRMVLGWSVVLGAVGCVIPAQQQQQQQPWGSQAPGGAAPAPAAGTTAVASGTCESACGQIAGCELATYEVCLDACPGTSAEQLDAITRSSCEQLAAAAGVTPATAPEAAVVNAATESRSAVAAGRWISTEWATVTNPAMTSADFYLSIAVDADGRFRGSWARYICLSEAYGIISCSLGPIEGDASGQLAADGSGVITLDRLGRSALAWHAKSGAEIAIELPRDWQGDRLLYRSSVKR